MSISLYQVSVPVFIKFIGNLSEILNKASVFATEKKIEPSVFLETRLYPNMFTFGKQIQRVADNATAYSARLAGKQPPVFENKLASFDDFQLYLQASIDYLKSLKPEEIDGQELREISIPRGTEIRVVQGQTHLLNNILPNFYFHLTTAYAILRSLGLDVGKQDFLGRS
ncbi:MAG: DUF1993 family protein [Methylophilaceae bacterium]|jgi:hypothetical protein|nr:DUF1993 domain-containing protein [Methyloradius sp.]